MDQLAPLLPEVLLEGGLEHTGEHDDRREKGNAKVHDACLYSPP